MKIGSRYTKERVLKRATTDYEELNAHVSGHEFAIQSALIGAPLDVASRKIRAKDMVIYGAALAISILSAAVSLQ